MERTILHADLDAYYASVECLYNPEIRNKPVAVCGDPERRHGIILAKNYIAKGFGVKAGQALWEAKQLCPDIVFVGAHYDKYLAISAQVRELYSDYSDQVECYGLDENWVDTTGSGRLGTGEQIAKEIQERVLAEIGLSVSIGVSFNKVIAKLGSDLNKPHGIAVITPENFKNVVFPLPVGDLLYVGRATQRKMRNYGINTIGALAECDGGWMERRFGKIGFMLWNFANGRDYSPVSESDAKPIVKSIGNSTTAPRDLVSHEDVKITLYALAESVSERLRDLALRCTTVQVSIRDNSLSGYERQMKLPYPTCATLDIFHATYQLTKSNHLDREKPPIRSIGVRGCGLVRESFTQLSLYSSIAQTQKQEQLDTALDGIRRRFGHFSVQRGFMLTDNDLSALDAKTDHVIHPMGFLNSGQ